MKAFQTVKLNLLGHNNEILNINEYESVGASKLIYFNNKLERFSLPQTIGWTNIGLTYRHAFRVEQELLNIYF